MRRRKPISIHALRGEGDNGKGGIFTTVVISIHALRGEGDHRVAKADRFKRISIHALRGEGDVAGKPLGSVHASFQSTPSVGRATVRGL